MQELADAIEQQMDGKSEMPNFLEVSQKWANHCLATYRDGLLTKGLQIAKALAEFDCELKHPGIWE